MHLIIIFLLTPFSLFTNEFAPQFNTVTMNIAENTCRLLYDTDEGIILAIFYNRTSPFILSQRIHYISRDSGNSFAMIKLKASDLRPFAALEAEYGLHYLVLYNEGEPTVYYSNFSETLTELVTPPVLKLTVSENKNELIFAMIDTSDNLHVYFDSKMILVSKNVERCLWIGNIRPEIYFLVNLDNHKFSLRWARFSNYSRIYTINSNTSSIFIYSHYLFIEVSEKGPDSRKFLDVFFGDQLYHTYFPSKFQIFTYSVIAIHEEIVFMAVDNHANGDFWLCIGTTIDWKFVRTIRIVHIENESIKNEVLVSPVVPGVILVNTYDDVSGSKEMMTKISYNYGKTWNFLNLGVLHVNNVVVECIYPECLIVLKLVDRYDNDNVAMVDNAPHLIFTTGYTRKRHGGLSTYLFVSRDGGGIWTILKSGHYLIDEVDHGAIILALEKKTNAIECSYDEGRTWMKIYQGHSYFTVTSVPQTLSKTLAILYVFADELKKQYHMVYVDFTKVLERPCLESDMDSWKVHYGRESKCFHGSMVEFKIKISNRKCFTPPEPLHKRDVKNCDCDQNDLACSFGFVYTKTGTCIRDSFHESKESHEDSCEIGTHYMESNPYMIYPNDHCEYKLFDKQDKSISKYRICGFGMNKAVVILYSNYKVYLNLDVETSFVPIDIHLYEIYDHITFDVKNQQYYYMQGGNIKVSKFLYGVDFMSKEIYSHYTNRDINYDWVGQNLYILQKEGIIILSVKMNVPKRIVNETDIKMFKLYVREGLIVYVSANNSITFLHMNGTKISSYPTSMDVSAVAYQPSNSTIYYYSKKKVYFVSLVTNKEIWSFDVSSQITGIEIYYGHLLMTFSHGIFGLIAQSILDIAGIKVINETHVPDCGCSHICINSGNLQVRCDCPENWKLKSDMKSCECTTKELCNPCLSQYHMCPEDGSCHSSLVKCDSYNDCPEGSDELNCPIKCSHGEFMCKNGKACINGGARCNNYQDCTDNSDEEDCPKIESGICNTGENVCKNLICVPSLAFCDGVNDCGDNSDEDGCKRCDSKHFQCDDYGFCLPMTKRCNGVFDCDDRTDEMNCSLIGLTLDPKHFLHGEKFFCDKNDSQELTLSKICDHFVDCKSGIDESLCGFELQCPKLTLPCQFEDKCYPASNVCDGIHDCYDGSDEKCRSDCSGHSTFQCGNEDCIDSSKYCDAIADCQDYSDEVVDCDDSPIFSTLSIFTIGNKAKVTFSISHIPPKGIQKSILLRLYKKYKLQPSQEFMVEEMVLQFTSTPNMEFTLNHLIPCQYYKISLIIESKSERIMHFTSDYVMEVPQNLKLSDSILSWNKVSMNCAPIAFYVECESRDSKEPHKNFTIESFYRLPSSRRLASCRVSHCTKFIFNHTCSDFSTPIYIDFVSSSRITTFLSFFFIVLLFLIVIYKYPKESRNVGRYLLSKTVSAGKYLKKKIYLRFPRLWRYKIDPESSPLLTSHVFDEINEEDIF